MADRPISFIGSLIRAILDGRKTQTRRIVKAGRKRCPYHVGQKLWAKEAWQHVLPEHFATATVGYRADYSEEEARAMGGWKSSRFMPRKFSRITLEVTAVRQENVQEITKEDAKAEGLRTNDRGQYLPPYDSAAGWVDPRPAFKELWESINAKRGYSWESNPEVDVVTFKVIDPALQSPA